MICRDACLLIVILVCLIWEIIICFAIFDLEREFLSSVLIAGLAGVILFRILDCFRISEVGTLTTLLLHTYHESSLF